MFPHDASSDAARPGPRILVSVPAHERPAFFADRSEDELAELASGVVYVDPAEVAGRTDLTDVEIAVVAWGFPQLNAERLAALPRLRLVVNAASSVKALVDDEFWDAGIPVSQSGAAMAPAVAELSLAMTLAMLRRLHRMDHALRGGQEWDRARAIDRAREIKGSRIGVVAASRTGREYIELCTRLGADVRVHDPYLADTDPLHERAAGLDELFAECDVIALHAPATPETEGLIQRAHIQAMPHGALLVNTARSTLVDMDALYDAAAAGRIDVALDVYDDEPLPVEDRWRSLPNVLLSGHVGGATRDSRARAGRIVLDEIRRFLAGEPLQHRVTREDLERMG